MKSVPNFRVSILGFTPNAGLIFRESLPPKTFSLDLGNKTPPCGRWQTGRGRGTEHVPHVQYERNAKAGYDGRAEREHQPASSTSWLSQRAADTR